MVEWLEVLNRVTIRFKAMRRFNIRMRKRKRGKKSIEETLQTLIETIMIPRKDSRSIAILLQQLMI